MSFISLSLRILALRDFVFDEISKVLVVTVLIFIVATFIICITVKVKILTKIEYFSIKYY